MASSRDIDRLDVSDRRLLTGRPMSAGNLVNGRGSCPDVAGSSYYRRNDAFTHAGTSPLDTTSMTAEEAATAAKIQEQLRLYREELVKKDRLLAKLTGVGGHRVAAVQPGSNHAKEPAAAATTTTTVPNADKFDQLSRVESLQAQLRETLYQLDIRKSEIAELKRLYDGAREAEAKNAQLVEQLRLRLQQRDAVNRSAVDAATAAAASGVGAALGAGGTTAGSSVPTANDTVLNEMQQMRDRISDLDSRLRQSLGEHESAERRQAQVENQFHDFVSHLSRLLLKDDRSHSPNELPVSNITRKAEELVQENTVLRNKMTAFRDYLLATEAEQRSRRDAVVKLMNEQPHISPLSPDMESLRMDRDKAISRQRELVSEIVDLKDQLENANQTCAALRQKLEETTKSPTNPGGLIRTDGGGFIRTEGGGQPETFMECLAHLLSDDYVKVRPEEGEIREHLLILVDSVHNKNVQLDQFRRKMATLLNELDAQHELTCVAEQRANCAEAAVLDLEDRLRGVDNALLASDIAQRELHIDHQRYVGYLERISRALCLDPFPDDISVDGATEAIIDRATQLFDQRNTDTKTLIYNLQRKVKSLKERLASKESEVESLQNKNKSLEDDRESRTSSQREKEDEYAKNRKLLKLVEKYKKELKDAEDGLHKLKTRLEEAEDAKEKVSEKDGDISRLENEIRQLEDVRHGQEHKITDLKNRLADLNRKHDETSNAVDRLTAELHRTKSTLADLNRQHHQLMELRHVIARMLGIRASVSSAADFEIVTRLEKMILTNQSKLAATVPVDDSFSELAEAFRQGRANSPATAAVVSSADEDEPPPNGRHYGDQSARSRSLSPTRHRDPNVY